jgi:hypothetical protein
MNLLKQEKPCTSKRNLPLLRIKKVVVLTEKIYKEQAIKLILQ